MDFYLFIDDTLFHVQQDRYLSRLHGVVGFVTSFCTGFNRVLANKLLSKDGYYKNKDMRYIKTRSTKTVYISIRSLA